MSIMFGTYGAAKIDCDLEEDRMRAELSAAKGEMPHALTRAEFNDSLIIIHHEGASGDIPEKTAPEWMKNRPVELKPGAYTEEEVEKIMAGSILGLDFGQYGKKWRLWVDGWPTQALKDATPWEV